MVQKDEVSKFFCPKSAHARNFCCRFYGIAERAWLHHVLIEVIEIYQKYPSESSSSWILPLCPKSKCLFFSLARVCWYLVFQYSSWVLTYWRSIFFFALVQPLAVLEEPKVRDLRHQWMGHDFPPQFLSFGAGCTRGWSSPSSETKLWSRCARGLSSSSSRLVHELDLLVFALTWQRLHVSFRDQVAHATCKIRQVQHNMLHCGVLSWRGLQAKSWTCHFVSLRIQINGHTEVFHLRKGKTRWARHLSQAHSTLVEHVVVEKWIMQASMQVLSELANTQELLQRQNSVVIPKYHACFLNLSIAPLDPIDRVQPRSWTMCVVRLAWFNGVATIHAVEPFCKTLQQLKSKNHQATYC